MKGGVHLFELLLERATRARQPRLDRARRDIEALADLMCWQVFEVRQDQDRSQALGQGGDALPELGVSVSGVRSRLGDRRGHVLLDLRLKGMVTFGFSHMIEHAASHLHHNPGTSRAAFRIKISTRFPNFQEDVMQDVLDLATVGDEPHTDAHEDGRPPLIQERQRLLALLCEQADQLFVGGSMEHMIFWKHGCGHGQ